MGSEAKDKKKMATMAEPNGLLDIIFSWSLPDVLNKDLYRGQVTKIPDTFTSSTAYFKSFVPALIEETHEDLMSSFKALRHAPAFEISQITEAKGFAAPKKKIYDVWLHGEFDTGSDGASKQLQTNDLIALTYKKPERVEDLRVFREPFLLALVCKADRDNPNELTILSSKSIQSDKKKDNGGGKKERLYGVYLINIMTNTRIWKALHPGEEDRNLDLIVRVLQSHTEERGGCLPCELEENKFLEPSRFEGLISSFNLNTSQEGAILSCLEARKCYHSNTIKLIWGPPGTGKTKTTSVLLLTLLQTRCRTLTCAPTNRAVVEVASRVMKLVSESSKMSGYGLGDVVLFGNSERMKIDDGDDLADVFLHYRVDKLHNCFMPLSGWRGKVHSMIQLLTNPKVMYLQHFPNNKCAENEEGEDIDSLIKRNVKQKWVEKIHKEVVSNASLDKFDAKKKKRHGKKQNQANEVEEEDKEEEQRPSFEEFLEKTFGNIRSKIELQFFDMCMHLPTTLLSSGVAEKMHQAVHLLRYANISAIIAYNSSDGSKSVIKDCLEILRSILDEFILPEFFDKGDIKKLCLGNACLLFCTASSSAKLYREEPVQFLVIDEAAQLKECESAIPLQLPRLRHAVLIGDELQLPAMIRSKMASEAELGRSLFERLVLLGQEKHMLDTQYRMHHSISNFPNRQFYNSKLLDAPSVRHKKYDKRFLSGNMYGPYSFINISCGVEQIGEGKSLKNNVEMAVVSELVSNLYQVSRKRKIPISVGVISPYKAQVFAIQDSIGKMYSSDAQGLFSLSIRSIDGFQGGEEDVIIISTVRSNEKGKVGFLSDRQRTNVALTRARFCLWILGNEATLSNSKSVWTKLIKDAKNRNCFHDARNDKSLAKIMERFATLEPNKLDKLQNNELVSPDKSKWKFIFNDEYKKSIEAIGDPEVYKKLASLLKKLSKGLFPHPSESHSLVSCTKVWEQEDKTAGDHALSLVWAIDIIEEESHHVQILRIWNVLPSSDRPRVVKRIRRHYNTYTKEKMLWCKSRYTQRNVTLPMKWPVESTSDLARSFASLNLMEK